MPATPQVNTEQGYIVDKDTGLFVPPAYRRAAPLSSVSSRYSNNIGKSAINADGYNVGVHLERDPDNLIVKWPERGSGVDDIACGAIVDGNIANVGAAPVIAPLISSLVRRQQDQAASAALTLSGRASPVKKAKDALLRFNDSPLGSTQAIMQMVHDLRTYNRGAPVATVPLHYASDDWAEYGLEPVPIVNQKGLYYLEVNWGKVGTPVPYLPSVFDLEPTGNPIWPYWYYKKIDNKAAWVLLHHTHVLPLTPGITGTPGIGLSSTWICLGVLAEAILVTDARIEKVANAVTEGIVLITGSDDPAEDVKKKIAEQRDENKAAGFTLNKGYTLMTSTQVAANIVQFQFRQDTGVTFKDRREFEEDTIAAAFSEPLSSLVTRGGVGYGAQAETTADNASEMGVGALLSWIATGLGAVYPRVQIAFSRASDRAKRLMLADLQTFALSMQAMPLGTLDPSEIRAMMQRDVIDIPEVGEDDIMTTAGSDENADEEGVNTGKEPEQRPADSTSNQQLTADIARAVMLAERANLEILYEDDAVTISDDDVDTAIELAGERVDPDFADLLNAVPVEE
ncbi:MAG: hypothetical protein ABI690_13495 [Chloroflexota bacterium]